MAPGARGCSPPASRRTERRSSRRLLRSARARVSRPGVAEHDRRQRHLSLRNKHSIFSDFTFTGTMDATGRRITGVVNGSGASKMWPSRLLSSRSRGGEGTLVAHAEATIGRRTRLEVLQISQLVRPSSQPALPAGRALQQSVRTRPGRGGVQFGGSVPSKCAEVA